MLQNPSPTERHPALRVLQKPHEAQLRGGPQRFPDVGFGDCGSQVSQRDHVLVTAQIGHSSHETGVSGNKRGGRHADVVDQMLGLVLVVKTWGADWSSWSLSKPGADQLCWGWFSLSKPIWEIRWEGKMYS